MMKLLTKNINVKLAFLLLIFFVCLKPAYAFENWKNLHEQADAMTLKESQKNYQENQSSLEAQYILGIKYLLNHDISNAEKMFDQMIEQDFRHWGALWGKAEVAKHRHQFVISERLLKNVIVHDPDFAPPYITLAYINYVRHNLNESIRLTTIVIVMDHHLVDARNRLYAHGLYAGARGLLAHSAGPIAKTINGISSLRHLQIIKKLDDQSFVYFFGWGTFYSMAPKMLGRSLQKAETLLKKAIEIDPQVPDVYVRLAQVYRMMGREKLYDAYIERALMLDPKSELALDIKSRTCQFICLDQIQ